MKNIGLDWSILPHQQYSPILGSSDFHLFPSLQNAPNHTQKKNSQEDQVKTGENLSSKPSNILLERNQQGTG